MRKKIWQDPVWSKVIAGIILGILTLIYSGLTASSAGKTFWEQFITIWTHKFELWKYALFLAALFVIFYFIRRAEKRNNMEQEDDNSIVEQLLPSPIQNTSSNCRVLFDMNKADKFWFYIYPEFF